VILCTYYLEYIEILSVNNGLIFFKVDNITSKQFVVCNPATKRLIKLPQLDCNGFYGLACDLFVDLQSNTYKIFLLDHHKANFLTLNVYNSITNMWQPLDSFTNFNPISNLNISALTYCYLRKKFMLY
jgi:hypothetical protein